MKVLIDTNILISAALSAGGTPFLAYVKAAACFQPKVPEKAVRYVALSGTRTDDH